MAIGKPLTGLYGVIAEFPGAQELLDAANAAREAGYTEIDAFSPFPIHGLNEAVGFHKTPLPLIVLIGGILGGLGGFFMCYYANVIAYPRNIGGKPKNPWPAGSPTPFQGTTLPAALPPHVPPIPPH